MNSRRFKEPPTPTVSLAFRYLKRTEPHVSVRSFYRSSRVCHSRLLPGSPQNTTLGVNGDGLKVR
jgi:hypothetical protein